MSFGLKFSSDQSNFILYAAPNVMRRLWFGFGVSVFVVVLAKPEKDRRILFVTSAFSLGILVRSSQISSGRTIKYLSELYPNLSNSKEIC